MRWQPASAALLFCLSLYRLEFLFPVKTQLFKNIFLRWFGRCAAAVISADTFYHL